MNENDEDVVHARHRSKIQNNPGIQADFVIRHQQVEDCAFNLAQAETFRSAENFGLVRGICGSLKRPEGPGSSSCAPVAGQISPSDVRRPIDTETITGYKPSFRYPGTIE